MLYKLLAIAKNTFIESLRQPVYAIIIIAALIMLILSPSLSMYTMSEDNKLLREIGLSTIFLSGLFISIFAACSAITEEIETKTVTTVISKPVSRYTFILGKFIGISGAVFLSHYLLTLAHMLVVRHGVMETATHLLDFTVIGLGGGALLASITVSALLNYFYDWKFTSTAITLLTLSTSLVVLVLCFIDPQWQFNPQDNKFEIFDVLASLLLLQAIIIIIVIAIMFSTRFNIVVTLSSCVGIFLLGLTNDYFFGRAAQTQIWAKIMRTIIPNFQIFWISDAIYEGTTVPLSYIFISTSYLVFYVIAVLFLSIALFHRRQVG